MKSNILGNTCIRVDRDELQIARCKAMLLDMNDGINELTRAISLAGNEVRMKILLLIRSEGRLCVCDMSNVLDMKIPAVSQHLRKMKDAGIVFTERAGTVIYYHLAKGFDETFERLAALIPKNVMTVEL